MSSPDVSIVDISEGNGRLIFSSDCKRNSLHLRKSSDQRKEKEPKPTAQIVQDLESESESSEESSDEDVSEGIELYNKNFGKSIWKMDYSSVMFAQPAIPKKLSLIDVIPMANHILPTDKESVMSYYDDSSLKSKCDVQPNYGYLRPSAKFLCDIGISLLKTQYEDYDDNIDIHTRLSGLDDHPTKPPCLYSKRKAALVEVSKMYTGHLKWKPKYIKNKNNKPEIYRNMHCTKANCVYLSKSLLLSQFHIQKGHLNWVNVKTNRKEEFLSKSLYQIPYREKLINCPICSISAKTHEYLCSHAKQQHNLSLYPIACPRIVKCEYCDQPTMENMRSVPCIPLTHLNDQDTIVVNGGMASDPARSISCHVLPVFCLTPNVDDRLNWTNERVKRKYHAYAAKLIQQLEDPTKFTRIFRLALTVSAMWGVMEDDKSESVRARPPITILDKGSSGTCRRSLCYWRANKTAFEKPNVSFTITNGMPAECPCFATFNLEFASQLQTLDVALDRCMNCPYCMEEFRELTAYQDHVCLEHNKDIRITYLRHRYGENLYRCPYCSYELVGDVCFSEHLIARHDMSLEYKCSPCQEELQSITNFALHFEKIHDTKIVQEGLAYEEPKFSPRFVEFREKAKVTPNNMLIDADKQNSPARKDNAIKRKSEITPDARSEKRPLVKQFAESNDKETQRKGKENIISFSDLENSDSYELGHISFDCPLKEDPKTLPIQNKMGPPPATNKAPTAGFKRPATMSESLPGVHAQSPEATRIYVNMSKNEAMRRNGNSMYVRVEDSVENVIGDSPKQTPLNPYRYPFVDRCPFNSTRAPSIAEIISHMYHVEFSTKTRSEWVIIDQTLKEIRKIWNNLYPSLSQEAPEATHAKLKSIWEKVKHKRWKRLMMQKEVMFVETLTDIYRLSNCKCSLEKIPCEQVDCNTPQCPGKHFDCKCSTMMSPENIATLRGILMKENQSVPQSQPPTPVTVVQPLPLQQTPKTQGNQEAEIESDDLDSSTPSKSTNRRKSKLKTPNKIVYPQTTAEKTNDNPTTSAPPPNPTPNPPAAPIPTVPLVIAEPTLPSETPVIQPPTISTSVVNVVSNSATSTPIIALPISNISYPQFIGQPIPVITARPFTGLHQIRPWPPGNIQTNENILRHWLSPGAAVQNAEGLVAVRPLLNMAAPNNPMQINPLPTPIQIKQNPVQISQAPTTIQINQSSTTNSTPSNSQIPPVTINLTGNSNDNHEHPGFLCPVCKFEFLNEQTRSYHQKFAHAASKYFIEHINFPPMNPQSPNNFSHMYMCIPCKVQFLDSTRFKHHYQNFCEEGKNSKFRCDFCDFVGKDLHSVVCHMDIIHFVLTLSPSPCEPKLTCSHCPREFYYPNGLTNHQLACCPYCYYWAPCQTLLLAHAVTVHSVKCTEKSIQEAIQCLAIYDLRRYRCPICTKTFSGQYKFWGHVFRTHGLNKNQEDFGQVRCNQCHLKIREVDLFLAHYQHLHKTNCVIRGPEDEDK